MLLIQFSSWLILSANPTSTKSFNPLVSLARKFCRIYQFAAQLLVVIPLCYFHHNVSLSLSDLKKIIQNSKLKKIAPISAHKTNISVFPI